jgi:release factor glutamine methyltransferase
MSQQLVRSVTTLPTAAEATARLAKRFREAGLEMPALDARLLVAHALGVSSAALLAHPERSLTSEDVARVTNHEARRLAREPVSRIIGGREFYGRWFRLSPATLDPRPETERLIDVALEVIDRAGLRREPLEVLDIGTGTGCILLTMLAELPAARGIGTDLSREALSVARNNAGALGLSDRARFVEGKWSAACRGPFDIVFSNPPYIASGEIAGLEPEVVRYDPRLALDGGADGLGAYRAILAELDPARIGVLLLEVGSGQAAAVTELACNQGFALPTVHKDLAGIDRVVAAWGCGLEKHKNPLGMHA